MMVYAKNTPWITLIIFLFWALQNYLKVCLAGVENEEDDGDHHEGSAVS